ncbi:hypothetical protein CHGG_11104 [Chaetomium globosum CBS 148.51]|uniref:Uncharacterized protein n=1 Tax=Chaetomium globosum (strain ATCC 6205 / CBS 148.51 / DSM 1962 / NBRC 6347 / NRRL 1970) TaxID=306901 RepID=Q2GLW8_CHAGB|nr:hypothetical protein CHGG_11104 [Chaetomium globosum CBS 148.51]
MSKLESSSTGVFFPRWILAKPVPLAGGFA